MSASCLALPVVGQSSAAESGSLLERWENLPDPRSRQGRRYELGYLLGLVGAAIAAVGHDTLSAIAQWAAEAPARVLADLGGPVDPFTGTIGRPSRTTIGRVLGKVDADRVQEGADAWTAANATPASDGAADPDDAAPEESGPLPAVAIDGKSVRGAATGGAERPHLLAAATHDGIVLTQRQIPDKGSEIHELAPLIDPLDLNGTVVTIDALHTQRDTAEHLAGVKGAHYLMIVKANQPTLFTACQAALSGPASAFTPEHISYDRGHGRTEQRTTRAVAITDHGIDWPHATHVFRIRRDTGHLDGQRLRKEIAYGITSLPASHAQPAHLAHHTRRHWSCDGGCAFPGCTRPASWCNAHHIVHWVDGGETNLDNLVLLCSFHHTVVHHRG